MKRRKIVLTLALLAFSTIGLGVGAACSDKEEDGPLGEAYEWEFDKPFAGEIDDYMTMDGKLDEEVWEDNEYLAQTTLEDSWSATTHFSEKGVYIGVKATDETMYYTSRYRARSTFSIFLCKTGTPTYNVNNTEVHQGRTFQFALDPYYCRPWKNRIPYYYETYIDGPLDGENWTTMTAELFLTWEDLQYTEEELGENGYPEDIQMYVNYNGQSREVLGTCSWREETFPHFGANGYKGNIEHDELGNVENGVASTDKWEINEQGNPQTTAGRTQVLWSKEAFAKDFVFEAELKPLREDADGNRITLRGSAVSGRFGLIVATPLGFQFENNGTSTNNISVFSASVTSFLSNTLSMQTCRQIDSFHWQNYINLKGSVPYEGDTVTLRIAKQGDTYYYFYGDSYWKSERIERQIDEVYCGIYTSEGVEVLNTEFKDFTGNEEGFRAELGKYVHFINIGTIDGGGTVTPSSYAVTKGEAVTLSFLPNSRNILTQVKLNGVDMYDEIVAEMNEKCEYTFTPDGEVTIDAKYTAFKNVDLVETIINLVDDEGNAIAADYYEVKGSQKLLYYAGQPTTAGGYIVLRLPKANTQPYVVDGREIAVDGIYNFTANFIGYRDYADSFELKDGMTSTGLSGNIESVTENRKFTYHGTVVSHDYGAVVVNDKTIGSTTSPLEYNKETGNYYITGSNNFSSYMKAYVSDTFWVTAEISMSGLSGTGNFNADPISGLIFHNGSSYIEIKEKCQTEGDTRLVITTEASGVKTEVCVAGFDAVAYIAATRTVIINVARYQDKIYVMNSANEVKVILSADGYQLLNGAAVSWSGSKDTINANLKTFFMATRPENAIGMLNFQGTDCTVEWDYTKYTSNRAEIEQMLDYGVLTFDASTGDYTATNIAGAYLVGEKITLSVKANAANQKVDTLTITYEDGSTETITGTYDPETNESTFTFTFNGPCEISANLLSKKTVQLSGTVFAGSGVDLTKVEVIIDGETYTGKIAANGSFAFDVALYTQEYTLQFSTYGYAAYVDIAVSDEENAYDLGDVTMVSDLYELGNYKGYVSSLSSVTESDLALGKHTVTSSNYTLLMPNTATAENYTFAFTMSDIVYTANNAAGDQETMGVSIVAVGSDNITRIITVTFRRWGKICVRFGATNEADKTVWYTHSGENKGGTMRVVRTRDSITVSMDGGWSIIFTENGIATNPQMNVAWNGSPMPEATIQKQLPSFFEDGSVHVVGYSSYGSEGKTSTVTYTVKEFTVIPVYEVSGVATFNGVAQAGVKIMLGSEVLATTNANGEYTLSLAAGSYTLLFQGENISATVQLTVANDATLPTVVLSDSTGKLNWLWGDANTSQGRDDTYIEG